MVWYTLFVNKLKQTLPLILAYEEDHQSNDVQTKFEAALAQINAMLKSGVLSSDEKRKVSLVHGNLINEIQRDDLSSLSGNLLFYSAARLLTQKFIQRLAK